MKLDFFSNSHSFLPLDEEEASFTKFLQFYCELQIDLGGVDRVKLLETLMAMNQVLPMGTCVLVEPRPELKLPAMVGLRYIQGYPLREVIDQGAFSETLFLFDMACDMLTMAVDSLLAGASPEDVLKKLRA